MSTVIVVHAKGESSRLPGKNMRMLEGKPLVAWALGTALSCKEKGFPVTGVIIDSDSVDILSVGEQMGAIPVKRPAHLANNDTTGDDLAYYQAKIALKLFDNPLYLMQLVPTCPFTTVNTIVRAMNALESGRRNLKSINSVFAARSEPFYTWGINILTKFMEPNYLDHEGVIKNSQSLVHTLYETGGLYASNITTILSQKRRIDLRGGRSEPVFVTPAEAIDINTKEDFNFAELVAAGLGVVK